MLADCTPGADAVNVTVPGVRAERTIAVAAPLNSFIRGAWNDIVHVGSPLAVA